MVHPNDREPMTSARQAAEALFAPKPVLNKPPVSDPAQPVEARKRRILPALPPAPIRRETVDAAARPKHPAALEIPFTKSPRIRTLVKYGMTVAQVAEVYGVPIETIVQILRKG